MQGGHRHYEPLPHVSPRQLDKAVEWREEGGERAGEMDGWMDGGGQKEGGGEQKMWRDRKGAGVERESEGAESVRGENLCQNMCVKTFKYI